MNENGFSLTSMLVLCTILLLGFFSSMIIAKKNFNGLFDDVNLTNSVDDIKKNEDSNIDNIDSSDSKNNVVKTTSDIDYSIYEEQIKKAAINAKVKRNIKVSELVELGYLKEIHDPKNYENVCKGYVVYKDSEYVPYLKCVGSYSTNGYELNLE